jgi:hypothetical protein
MSLSVACGGGATVVGVEQVGGETEAGTTVIRFDPEEMVLGDSVEPVAGTCIPSQAVLGAYRCLTEGTGETVDPCLLLAGGDLLCEPNPVTGDYTLLLRPTGPLAPSAAQADADPFLVELEGNMTTCARRTGSEILDVAGVEARYDCDVPGTYLLGLEKANAVWVAGMCVFDASTSSCGESGITLVNVLRAWTVQ